MTRGCTGERVANAPPQYELPPILPDNIELGTLASGWRLREVRSRVLHGLLGGFVHSFCERPAKHAGTNLAIGLNFCELVSVLIKENDLDRQ